MDWIQPAVMFAVSTVFAIIGFLLVQKDNRQEERMNHIEADFKQELQTLYKLHAEDVAKLAQLEIKIAENHYPKPELNERFSKLDATIQEGFRSLGNDMKAMVSALHDHLKEHNHKGQ